ncbi:DUF2470 domain-containing protein [Kineococcus aurantiacus]|uniref:DUF2470 domain-containing protein n=1 Tax=Kineococcus aurantiacus TaxID=37633 RepID=A0A7Y9DNN1_9ACTN|nr:DUF2470 domain-containing protein [Kineococcus aurantiacus]NYD23952.1 hypothetical protein [Kineococcus aurantiacus]
MRLTTAPTPAEWARTLAVGTVPGTLHLPRVPRPCAHHGEGTVHDGAGEVFAQAAPARRGRAATPRTEAFAVQHLTDAWGGLLLLLEDGSPVHRRLLELGDDARWNGVPVVLDVLDVPPGQAALPRARLCVTGWVESILPADQRRVAQTAAAVRPLGALLDVGTTRSVWRLEVADVRVTTATGVHLLEDEEFTAAAPDPLYDDEDGIVAHLETHHRDALVGWVLDALPAGQAHEAREVAVVGADRYGLDVLVTVGGGTTTLRAAFAAPVRDGRDVARALCGLFGCPCRGTGSTHASA